MQKMTTVTQDAEPDHGPTRGQGSRASIRQVADLAGVAPSSVSRVLSGSPAASPEMREKVLHAVRELQYEPDFLAQSLRRKRTLSVGFLIADISNPVLAAIVQGAEESLRRNGYTLLLVSSENRSRNEPGLLRFLSSRRVDGLLVSLTDEKRPQTVEAITDLDLPMVFVDRRPPEGCLAEVVGSDHSLGMEAAVEHLIALGHRRIAQISGSLGMLPSRERLAAMNRVVERHSDVETHFLPGSLLEEHGYDATCQLLALEPRPTALVIAGNQILAGCLVALDEHGIQVGRDMSVVACDETPVSRLFKPRISVIERDKVGIGRVAAERLLELIIAREQGRFVARQPLLLPTAFIDHGSCSPPK
jgi:LacI family transcriptional regulator